MQHATGIASSHSKSAKHKANHLALSRYLETELAPVVVQAQPDIEADPPSERNRDELFVYPWMGVVANLPTEWKDGKYNDKLHQKYNDEILKMQQTAKNHFQRICQEHNKVKSELDTQRQELERRREELEKREAQNETERNKLAEEKLQ
ncbi:hypothetical protein MKW98_008525, partial [Papaver atlanticum]